MDTPPDIATFRSERFAPFLPDAKQVNPEVYGAELAYWLATELARRGVYTSYPGSEDWGWYLDYAADAGDRFSILCGNVVGTKDQWIIALRRHGKGMLGRQKPAYSAAGSLSRYPGRRVLRRAAGRCRMALPGSP